MGNQSRKNSHNRRSSDKHKHSKSMVNKKDLTLTDDDLVLPRRRAFSAHKRRPANLRLKTLKHGGAKQAGGTKEEREQAILELITSPEIDAKIEDGTITVEEYKQLIEDLKTKKNELETDRQKTRTINKLNKWGMTVSTAISNSIPEDWHFLGIPSGMGKLKDKIYKKWKANSSKTQELADFADKETKKIETAIQELEKKKRKDIDNKNEVSAVAAAYTAPTLEAAEPAIVTVKDESVPVVPLGKTSGETPPTGPLTVKLIGPTGSVLDEAPFTPETPIEAVITKWEKEIKPKEGLAANVPVNDPRRLKEYVLYFDDPKGSAVKIDYEGTDAGKPLNAINTEIKPETTSITLRLRSKLYTFFEQVLYGDLYYLVDVLYIRNLYDYLANAEEKAEYVDLIQFKDSSQGPGSASEEGKTEEVDEFEGGGEGDEMEGAEGTEVEGTEMEMEGGKRHKARTMAKARKMLRITDGTITGEAANEVAADIDNEFSRKALAMSGGALGMKWRTKREKETEFIGFPVPEITPPIEPKKDTKKFLMALIGVDTAEKDKTGKPLSIDDTLFNEFFYPPGSKEMKTEGINELIATMDTSLLGRVSQFLTDFMVCKVQNKDGSRADAGKSLMPEQGIPILMTNFVKEGSGFSELWQDDKGVKFFKDKLDLAQEKITRTEEGDEIIEDMPEIQNLPVAEQLARLDKKIDAEIEVFNLIAPKVVDDGIDDWRGKKEGQLYWNKDTKKFELLKAGVRAKERKASAEAELEGGATTADDHVPVTKETDVEELYKLLTKVRLYYEENENMKDTRMYDLSGDVIKPNIGADAFNKWVGGEKGQQLPYQIMTMDVNGKEIEVEEPGANPDDKPSIKRYNGKITDPVEVIDTFISNYKFFRIMATMDIGDPKKGGNTKTWYRFYDQFIRRTARLLQRDESKKAQGASPAQGGPSQEVPSEAELKGTIYSEGLGDVPRQRYDLGAAEAVYAQANPVQEPYMDIAGTSPQVNPEEEGSSQSEDYLTIGPAVSAVSSGGAKPANTLIETNLINEFIDNKARLTDPSLGDNETQRKAVTQLIVFANFINLTLVKNLASAGLQPPEQKFKGGAGTPEEEEEEARQAEEAKQAAKDRPDPVVEEEVRDTVQREDNKDLLGKVIDTAVGFSVAGAVVTAVTNAAAQAAISSAANYIGVVMYPAVMHAYSVYFLAASQALGFAGASVFSAGIGAVVIVAIWAINSYLKRLAKKSDDFFIAVDKFMALLKDMTSPPDKLNEAYTSLIRNYASTTEDSENIYIKYLVYRLFEDTNVYRLRALLRPPAPNKKEEVDFFNVYQLAAQKGKAKPFTINTKKSAEISAAWAITKDIGSWLGRKLGPGIFKFKENKIKIKDLIKKTEKALDKDPNATELRTSIQSAIAAAIKTGKDQKKILDELEKDYKSSKGRLDPKGKIDALVKKEKFTAIPRTIAFMLAATTDGDAVDHYKKWIAYFRVKYGTAEEKNVFADIDKHISAYMDARTLLRVVINEPNKALKSQGEDALTDTLQMKYYLNFICYAFLSPRKNAMVTMLENKNVLKKMNAYYQFITQGDFEQSFKLTLKNNGELFDEQLKKRGFKFKSRKELSNVAEIPARKKDMAQMIKVYAKNRMALSDKSADKKNLLLFFLGKVITGGKVGVTIFGSDGLLNQMVLMEKYFSMLRCKQFTDEGQFISLVDDIPLNDKRVYANLITLYNKIHLENGRPLLELSKELDTTKGKDNDSKLLKRFFNYKDSMGGVKQVNILMQFLKMGSNNVLMLADAYKNIVKDEKASAASAAQALIDAEAAKDAADAEKDKDKKSAALKEAADGIVEAATDIKEEYGRAGEEQQGEIITNSIAAINAALDKLNADSDLTKDKKIKNQIRTVKSALQKVTWEAPAAQGGGGGDGTLLDYRAAVNIINPKLRDEKPVEETDVNALIDLKLPIPTDKDEIIPLIEGLNSTFREKIRQEQRDPAKKAKYEGFQKQVEEKLKAIKESGVNVGDQVKELNKEQLLEAINAYKDLPQDENDSGYTVLIEKLNKSKKVISALNDTEKNQALKDITESGKPFKDEKRDKVRLLLEIKAEPSAPELSVEASAPPAPLVNLSGDLQEETSESDVIVPLEAKKNVRVRSSETDVANTQPEASNADANAQPEASTADSSSQTADQLPPPADTPQPASAPATPAPKDKKAAAEALLKAATELQNSINGVVAAAEKGAKTTTPPAAAAPPNALNDDLMKRIQELEDQINKLSHL